MPLVHITLAAGRPAADRRRIADAVHKALVEVPRENWSFGGGVMSYPPVG